MRERNPCVYIMASRHYGTLYTGATADILARVIQHRKGTFDGFTAEKRIKRWRRDWKIALIERDNLHWEDLAVSLLGLPPLP